MPENFKTADDVIREFNASMDVLVKEAQGGHCTVGAITVMGYPISVPRHSSVWSDGVKEATQAAKKVVTSLVGISKGEELIWLITEALEREKYYGDSEDPQPCAHNKTLDMIIEMIPDFVKGLGRGWT